MLINKEIDPMFGIAVREIVLKNRCLQENCNDGLHSEIRSPLSKISLLVAALETLCQFISDLILQILWL